MAPGRFQFCSLLLIGHPRRVAVAPSGNKRLPAKMIPMESSDWCQIVLAMYVVFVKSAKLEPTKMHLP